MFIARFGHRHTAADAANKSFLCIRNPSASGMRLLIRKILFSIGFDDTTAVDNGRAAYGLTRYRVGAAGDMTGGSSPVRANTNTQARVSCITDACIKTGALLTDTDVVYDGHFHEVTGAANAQAEAIQEIKFENPDEFVLLPGEGLAIRTAATATTAQGFAGSIWWEEVNL